MAVTRCLLIENPTIGSTAALQIVLCDLASERPTDLPIGSLVFSKDDKVLAKFHDGTWNPTAGSGVRSMANHFLGIL